jgi:UDP-glucose 4-epimerase
MENYEKGFQGKNIMITGGLGFIGSNLAHRLVDLNPNKIVIVDSLVVGLGGNPANIQDIKEKVEIHNIDMGDKEKMRELIKGIDFVFNLAGSVSHSGSKENPLRDLELNLISHVHFLEVCREYMEKSPNAKLKILFAGTRDQYGKVKEEFLPVNEKQLVHHAADPQGINKYSTEFYHLLYRGFGIQAVSLRMTNTYGPRQQMVDAGRGVLNWFMRKAIEGEDIELWGGGNVLRDFNYVDDVVEAMLVTMVSEETDGEVYNLGSFVRKKGKYTDLCGNICSIEEMAKRIIEAAETKSNLIVREYPKERQSLEPGHFYADITKIHKSLGWEPKTEFIEGIKKTIEFYKKNKKDYW